MPLDPDVAALMARAAAAGRPAISAGTPDDARAMLAAGRAALGAGPEMATVSDLAIATRGGEISARLFVPEGRLAGLIVYLHGGGWVLGTLDDYDAAARLVAAKSGCAVLMPDYRLAPEHAFPAGLEDCEDALLFAARDVVALCGEKVPLALAGDSAGANLGTVALRRLAGRLDVVFQALIYPVADADFDRTSYRDCSEGMLLTGADMAWFFEHYAPRTHWRDPDIAPIHAADLARLPPTLVVSAEYDVLRDEGEAYARRLADAGVAVELRRADGLIHGFARLHNHVPAADRIMAEIAGDIGAACRAAGG